ncbi:PQQ-binding-like beta-propeller repeat protein [Corallococcus sp. EGB]|uniref:outer membrane protein assembly factor BamB family protein n=1 Tax=Corallococcus sp. EGB TaxID=1521117 RepID=UPI001CBFC381|nr:PQQ-binding-like beta-propeller repeat protein [Corallococcus sp. EGB]
MACQRAPVEPAFQYSSDASSRTGLTALPDGVLLGNEAGAVVRLDREGRPLWTTRLGREVAVAPAPAGDSVIVGTVVGEVASLSLQDGKERWRLGGEPPVLTPPVVDDAGHTVFLVAPDGTVRALAVDSGRTRWKRAPQAPGSVPAESLGPQASVAPAVRAAPVLVEGVLVVPLASGLWALDAQSGEPRWSRPVTDVVGLDSERDTVFAATRPGRVLAVSVKDGSTRWEQHFADGVTGPPARALGALWVGAGPSSLVGLSTAEGRELARVALPSPLVGRVQVGLEDLLLVPTSGHEGRLIALKAPGWTPAFTVRADTPLRTRPVVRGLLVFVQGLDGRVLAWRLRVPPPA